MRRRSPPDSRATSASSGGTRSAALAMSTRWPVSHPPTSSMAAWTVACSAMIASMSASGSAMAADRSLNRARSACVSARPARTLSWTDLEASRTGSCARYPTFTPSARHTVPSNSESTPASALSSVDFPTPLGPSRPILAPRRNDTDRSRNTTRPPGRTLLRPRADRITSPSTPLPWRAPDDDEEEEDDDEDGPLVPPPPPPPAPAPAAAADAGPRAPPAAGAAGARPPPPGFRLPPLCSRAGTTHASTAGRARAAVAGTRATAAATGARAPRAAAASISLGVRARTAAPHPGASGQLPVAATVLPRGGRAATRRSGV
jgi:hypothetical protein